MERYDFYRYFSSLSTSEIVKNITSNNGEDEYTRLISRSENLISAAFSYRSDITNSYFNQFGEREEFSYQYWSHVNFYLLTYEQSCYVVVENPSRSLQRFFNKWSGSVDFNSKFDELNLEALYDWLVGFKSLRVVKAKYKNITVSGSTSAVIEMTSKGNAVKDISKLRIVEDAKLIKLKAEFYDGDRKVVLEVASNSTFSIDVSDGSNLEWLID
ncbi:MAG: hypothetical protein VXW16_04685, partial [Bacteroidota bacterium]|nr:hypothetical protein [Bacteroidota bacterium]MEC8568909.1 hypothetical protein [Pseudomonadota bacterium]